MHRVALSRSGQSERERGASRNDSGVTEAKEAALDRAGHVAPVYTYPVLCRSSGRQPFILQSELQTRHLSIWLTFLYKTGMVFSCSEYAL